MYKLFYFPRNASWAPHMVLHHMKVEYELVLVDRKTNEQKSESYLKLNPTGRIPTLVDGDLSLFESAAICLHLCDQNPHANLIPAIGNPDRPKFHQWLAYLTTTLQPELMIYFYPAKHTTDTAGELAIVAAQESRVAEMYSFLDEALEGREFLIGSNVSVCDYFLFMLAHWGSGFSRPPLSYPNLGAYLRRLAKRETVKAVCAVEGTDLGAYN
ncbi:glutathione S-transferase family protein [Marinimicrobium sp. ABcell2]|uniref:glutathione S-transferase family protein n=1 Tax=Marinimicrobium sp. ABcell2 TaxID=3069751 RepID=UPI0027B3C876|nr:glutathione S-transferase family protein [Marinimicrobium sp. ABcell2]MDQ2076265.1 glutathione S-transferase family protein [Marinimicrobium sp. ABcell2]